MRGPGLINKLEDAMKATHDFQTPRNIFEKLLRDYEHLDVLVSGDAMFNFISTAFHFQEWIKNSPLEASEPIKRLLKKTADHKNIKLCKDIVSAKKSYQIIIEDPNLPEGQEMDFKSIPSKFDKHSYEDGSKTFVFKVGDEEIDPFKFKEEILQLYSTYFQIK